jgi:hypothetical protein
MRQSSLLDNIIRCYFPWQRVCIELSLREANENRAAQIAIPKWKDSLALMPFRMSALCTVPSSYATLLSGRAYSRGPLAY